jgi:hypothetical protein
MRRNISASERRVVTSRVLPSEAFDELLLFKRGGKVIFHGEALGLQDGLDDFAASRRLYF